MTRTRMTAAALIAAAGLALAACSGSTGATPSAEPVASSAAAAPSATAMTDETDASSEPAAAGTALIGMVGTSEDPDAYEIELQDESGAPVTTLPAGDYTLTFADRSAAHNFHLTGPGGVDVGTDVGGVDESTVEISLEPGTYLFVCDPHVGSMSGQVEVTG